MDALAGCLTRGKVRRALQDLPRTLDETYDRVLRAINESLYAEEALMTLKWLTFAEEPLRACQVLELTGIRIDEERFDEDERLMNPHDILRICSSLVRISCSCDEGSTGDEMTEHVHLAHFTVKSYLTSGRASLPEYRFLYTNCHELLATSCIVYLLHQSAKPQAETTSSVWHRRNDLNDYAMYYWARHVRLAHHYPQRLSQLVTKLLIEQPPLWVEWYGINDRPVRMEGDETPSHLETTTCTSSDPLWVASKEGLEPAVRALLASATVDVNMAWGNKGNALQAAATKSHEDVIQLLLEHGADVNSHSGYYLGNALQIASFYNHKLLVAKLLASGADPNAEGGRYGTSLQVASVCGYTDIANMLLTSGANVNAKGGRYHTALQAASLRGSMPIVKLLLSKDAEVNAQGGRFHTALQAASAKGHHEVVEILLARGANVNAHGGARMQSAYSLAMSRGHMRIGQLLVAHGADTGVAIDDVPSLASSSAPDRCFATFVQMLQRLRMKNGPITIAGAENKAHDHQTSQNSE